MIILFLFILSSASTILSRYHNLPKPIEEQVQFFHYSRSNLNTSVELTIGQKLPAFINPKRKWKFFIHGWTTSPAVSPWFHTGKEAYLTNGDFNVIFVDWSKPANQSYLESVKSADKSGEFVAKFIESLLDNNVESKDIQLLGHSLGSHMAGFAGKYVYKLNGEKIGRITGLDPAGPVYESGPYVPYDEEFLLPESKRLSKNDANFVDIIHSDGGFYGMKSSIGHIDFYPNGGIRKQPGCEVTEDENCSHARSTKFYVESINSLAFVATKCSSYEEYQEGKCENNSKCVFGEHVDQSVRGNFYFNTNPEPPYAKGDVSKLNKLDN